MIHYIVIIIKNLDVSKFVSDNMMITEWAVDLQN
jgi:hypothetical protein